MTAYFAISGLAKSVLATTAPYTKMNCINDYHPIQERRLHSSKLLEDIVFDSLAEPGYAVAYGQDLAPNSVPPSATPSATSHRPN